MRMKQRVFRAALFLAGVWFAGASAVAAQDSQYMMPEQSAAKAKQILQQAIDALGGTPYLSLRDATCTGEIGSFDHSGDLTGFGKFIDYSVPPFKDRQENLPKRNIISVFNSDKGWELDRGGVSDAPQADLADFKDNVQKDIDYILRHRIHEPEMVLRYGGPDIVELRQVDWVELDDPENRTIRIAFSQATHLPIQKRVESRDPATRMKFNEVEYFSNYHPIGGIQTAFQITREKNGMKVFQAFIEKCEYNTGLSDSLFTKESLEERWAKVGKKEKEKKDKSGKNAKDREDADDKN